MDNNSTSDSLQKQRAMSFFSFISDNYELSKFVLPKKKPVDDSLDNSLMNLLQELMQEKDFYEINTIIRKRYSVK